jgi:hypothetical protein
MRDIAVKDDMAELQNEIRKRDVTIEELRNKLSRTSTEIASALAEFSGHRSSLEQEIAELKLQIKATDDSLVDLHKKADVCASVLAKFSDPVTGVKRRCPLIQNNGVVQSLEVLIGVWVKEPDMGQSHAFRMFNCPVTNTFAMISPVPILDAFLKVASSAGIDTTLPVVFHYKTVDDTWVEFSFHEQLELIARLCSIYRDRHNAERLPEQRSVSIQGEGAVVILMRSVAMGMNGFKLECFGMRNDGSGRMEINVVIDSDWSHPFEGMVFPVGSA